MSEPSAPALSCGFPPSRDFPEIARTAESLGYRRIWSYDSPALYGDLWVALGRAADRTERIGLGTAVAVPSLRDPVVTASAILTVEELAPGRVAVAFGSGFTARLALGRRAMRWSDVDAYVRQVRGLLRGEVVDVDGKRCQLIHSLGYAPARPVDVPLLVAPMGPKGFAVAEQVVADGVADGVVLTGPPPEARWSWCAQLVFGTVLGEGEDHTSARVRAAAGPWFAVSYHGVWEMAGEAVDGMPGGAAWRARIEAERPAGERHLAVHEGHAVVVTDRDRPLLDAAGPALLATGWTGTRAEVHDRFREAAAAGVTEVILTPTGPDPARELEAFAEAARG